MLGHTSAYLSSVQVFERIVEYSQVRSVTCVTNSSPALLNRTKGSRLSIYQDRALPGSDATTSLVYKRHIMQTRIVWIHEGLGQ